MCALLSIRPAPRRATPPPRVARSTVQPSASPSPPRCSPAPHASSTRSRARRRSTMLTDSHGPPVIPHLHLPRANYQPDPRRDHRAASALDPHAEAGPSLLNAPWPSPAPYASHPAALNPSRSPSRDPAPPAPLGLAVPLRRRGPAAPQHLCYHELLQKHRRRIRILTGRASFPLPRATHGNCSPEHHRAAKPRRIYCCEPSAPFSSTA